MSNNHWIRFVVSLGECSSNTIELFSLKITLQLVIMKGVQKIQVFGESKLVIVWLQSRIPPRNIYLRPIYEDIDKLPSS